MVKSHLVLHMHSVHFFFVFPGKLLSLFHPCVILNLSFGGLRLYFSSLILTVESMRSEYSFFCADSMIAVTRSLLFFS
jgi:hypothetical protein